MVLDDIFSVRNLQFVKYSANSKESDKKMLNENRIRLFTGRKFYFIGFVVV